MSGDGDDTCDLCGHTGYYVAFTDGGGARCWNGHGCQKANHPIMLQLGTRMCVCGEPASAHPITSDSDEGMLREAHDLIRVGVERWKNSTMAWVASEWLDRCARRLPEAVDVIDP